MMRLPIERSRRCCSIPSRRLRAAPEARRFVQWPGEIPATDAAVRSEFSEAQVRPVCQG
jgi:hypothetical protein